MAEDGVWVSEQENIPSEGHAAPSSNGQTKLAARVSGLLGLLAALVVAVGGCAGEATDDSDEGPNCEGPTCSQPRCGDGICEADESCSSCAGDCGACSATCGNDMCDSDETCLTCADDCGSCPTSTCGNEVCDPNETCTSCVGDCGACPPATCGDGICDSDEACTDCPDDCGACNGAGRVLQVGPGRAYATPCEASRAAQDGDVIEIEAGEYRGDVCAWTQNDLIVRGVGGFAHLAADGEYAAGRGIWHVQGDNMTVEWIEFSGASVPDENGAGIRLDGTHLTVRRCYFHDNENGILADGNDQSDILIEYTEFANNGYGDGQSHNFYINQVRSLTFRYSYSHHARIGHNLKSRALTNYILYNRIMDEADGTSSFAIDLPNGGLSYLIGNVIQQGPQNDNNSTVAYGGEGYRNPQSELYVAHNTFVNDHSSGSFFRISSGADDVRLVNNLFVGPGNIGAGSGAQEGNLSANDPGLLDRASYDYRLAPGSPAVDAGDAAGAASGFDLAPQFHYVHPMKRAPRPSNGALDVGAYEQ